MTQKNTYLVEDSELLVGGKRIDFGKSIRKVIEWQGMLIVLLLYGNDNRNIYAIDSRGEQVWRVEAPAPSKEVVYSDIYVENSVLKGYTTTGTIYSIDPASGSVTNITVGRAW